MPHSRTDLPLSPIQSVEQITYVDTNGVVQPLPTTEYVVYPEWRRLQWAPDAEIPELQEGVQQRVSIDFTAGWTQVADVPPQLVHGVKVYLTYLYHNRGDQDVMEPQAFDNLWLSEVEDYL